MWVNPKRVTAGHLFMVYPTENFFGVAINSEIQLVTSRDHTVYGDTVVNTWTHYCFSVDSESANFYVNGSFVSRNTESSWKQKSPIQSLFALGSS